MDFITYEKLGLNYSLLRDDIVNGRSNNEPRDISGDVNYYPCSDSNKNVNVPEGKIIHFSDWNHSEVFSGTSRDISIYVPVTSKTKDLGLIILQDGDSYMNLNGPVSATSVFDNLIYKKEIDPFIAIFVMPGRPKGVKKNPLGTSRSKESHLQRSIEYDSCDENYLKFILNELMPFVLNEISIEITEEPSRRLLIGMSSGGICSFNAAWHDPNSFGNVISHCGSFTNIRGGLNYPSIIRSRERKPIKVLLQSGKLDLNNIYGNWGLSNKEMASALKFAGYSYRFEFGSGGHSLNHGGSLFAESLKWIFKTK